MFYHDYRVHRPILHASLHHVILYKISMLLFYNNFENL